MILKLICIFSFYIVFQYKSLPSRKELVETEQTIYIYIYIYNSICFNKWHYFHQPSFYDIYIYIYIYISEKVCERSIASYLCFELYILTIVFMVQTCKLSHSVWGLRPEGQGCRVKIIGILT